MDTRTSIGRLVMLIGFWFPFHVQAQTQGKDGNGETVFDLSLARVQAGIKDPVEVSRAWFLGPSTWVNKRTRDITVSKEHRLVTKLAATNTGDKLTFQKLADVRLGGRFNVGYQWSLKDIPGLLNNGGIRGTWGFGGTAFIGVDNIRLYNASDSTISTVYPVSWGFTGAVNHLHRAWCRGKLMWLASLGVTVENTWNKDELISFVETGSSTSLPGAVAFSAPTGSYGAFAKGLWRGRIYAPLPVYYGWFAATPFCGLRVRENIADQYRVGFLVGFTGKAPEWKTFELPSVLSFGMDWTYSSPEQWSTATLFVTGSFKFK